MRILAVHAPKTRVIGDPAQLPDSAAPSVRRLETAVRVFATTAGSVSLSLQETRRSFSTRLHATINAFSSWDSALSALRCCDDSSDHLSLLSGSLGGLRAA